MTTKGTSSQATISRLRSAQIDERTENIRYRQGQLQSLHKGVTADHEKIREALRKDNSNWTANEVDSDFVLGLNALRDHYTSLDFEEGLKKEYDVAKGLDYADRRQGYGVVCITPAATVNTTSFFSILAPLSAAIAAGNCIMLQIDTDLRHTPAVLLNTFQKALDSDTFGVVGSEVDLEAAFPNAIAVGPGDAAAKGSPGSFHQLTPRSDTRNVAVVDRSTDVDQAARILVAARLAFGGLSSYAPDIILVNDFVRPAFLEAASRYLLASEASSAASQANEKNAIGGRVVTSGNQGSIVEVLERSSSQLVSEKQNRNGLLVVSTMSSLDDAINFFSSKGREAYRASYIFADAKSAKYLAQFVHAEVTFVNHIPPALLIGPPAPYFPAQPISTSYRYTPNMFSTSRPQYVPQSKTQNVSQGPLPQLDSALKPLPPTGQPLNHASIGFFEQGILTGLSLAALPILLATGTGTWYGLRFLWLRFNRM